MSHGNGENPGDFFEPPGFQARTQQREPSLGLTQEREPSLGLTLEREPSLGWTRELEPSLG